MSAATSNDEACLQALVRAIEKLQATTALEQVWHQGAAYLAQELQAALAVNGRQGQVWVWLASYDPVRKTLVGRDGVVPNPKEEGTLLRQRLEITAGDVWQQVLEQGQPLDIPDWNKEARRGEWVHRMSRWRPVGASVYPLPGGMGIAFLGISEWGATLRPDGKLRVRLFLRELTQQLQRLQERQKRQQTQQAGEFLIQVMDKCRQQKGYHERLAVVIEQLHQAVGADQTLLYAYDERASQFTLKTSAPRLRRDDVIPLAVLRGLYQELLLAERVVIPDASQAERMAIGAQFWQQYHAQALIAAPIYAPESKQLLGFCACLSRQPRPWDAFAETAVQGVAQLIALLSSLADLSQTLMRLETEQKVHIGIAQAIYGTQDWQQALKTAGQILDQHLPGDRWLLLHQNPDSRHYDIVHQSFKKRPIVGPLAALHELDYEALSRDHPVLAVPNWQTDLKLMTWRQTLQNQGVQAVLAANAVPERPPEILLVLTCSQPYAWSLQDRQFAQAVARQLGVVARQWYLHQAQASQTRLYQALAQALTLVEKPSALVQYLAQALDVPQVALVTWAAGAQTGQVVVAHPHHEPFAVVTDTDISLDDDPFIQQVIRQSEPWVQSGVDLEPETRRWLTGPGIERILAVPIGEPAQALLMLLDRGQDPWPSPMVHLLQVLAQVMAREQSFRQRLQDWQQGYLELACQDWWRQCLWPEWAAEISSLIPEQWPAKAQQARRWLQPDLSLHLQPVPLAGLLRRVSARVQDLMNERQVWFRVHQQGPEKAQVLGDGERLEFILAELLRFACQRSPQQGRVDIWCQLVSNGLMEVAITDYGPIPETLLEQLRPDHPDPLSKGVLNTSPMRELFLCRLQVQQMGGELFYEKLPDQRFSSRLWLSLAL
ncbi:MAG: GAF domain-containing protein [Gloeomargarita sp. SKYBB_i_bin120]|nr:GAF domain-containing protein [Gloeomargarita sp. SKYB120]MDW8178821.1 GAF domain-containing protein [Gloeomargarita sp. SKYBB_i_bin120]